MSMKRIITIGREFGSGGRELGRRLSEEMGIAYYDQEIITEIANRTSLSEQYVSGGDRTPAVLFFPDSYRKELLSGVSPVFEQSMAVFQEQFSGLSKRWR